MRKCWLLDELPMVSCATVGGLSGIDSSNGVVLGNSSKDKNIGCLAEFVQMQTQHHLPQVPYAVYAAASRSSLGFDGLCGRGTGGGSALLLLHDRRVDKGRLNLPTWCRRAEPWWGLGAWGHTWILISRNWCGDW